jgi:hypothetical protein
LVQSVLLGAGKYLGDALKAEAKKPSEGTTPPSGWVGKGRALGHRGDLS